MKPLTGWLVAWLGMWHIVAACAPRLIDMTGLVTRNASAARSEPLALFDTLGPRDTLTLGREASVTLVLEGSGQQYRLEGPGRWQFNGETGATLQGMPPAVLPVAAPALRPAAQPRSRVIAGATAMRARAIGELALSPDSTRLLRPPMVLRWTDAGEGARYRITLATAEGRAVYEGLSEVPQVSLPDPAQPQPGMSYAWSVDVVAGSQQGLRAFGAFTVADPPTQQQWSGLAPQADAPVSQWVLYAGALQRAGFVDEAASAWQKVTEQRPGARIPGRL